MMSGNSYWLSLTKYTHVYFKGNFLSEQSETISQYNFFYDRNAISELSLEVSTLSLWNGEL